MFCNKYMQQFDGTHSIDLLSFLVFKIYQWLASFSEKPLRCMITIWSFIKSFWIVWNNIFEYSPRPQYNVITTLGCSVVKIWILTIAFFVSRLFHIILYPTRYLRNIGYTRFSNIGLRNQRRYNFGQAKQAIDKLLEPTLTLNTRGKMNSYKYLFVPQRPLSHTRHFGF